MWRNLCPCNLIFNARRISHLPRVSWLTRAHTNRGECAPSRSWHDGQRIFIARLVPRDRGEMTYARERANRRPDGCPAGLCGDRGERKTKTKFSVKSARENWARDSWLLVSVTSRPHIDVGSCTAFTLFSAVPLYCCGLINVLLLRLRRAWRTVSLLIWSAAFRREREIASLRLAPHWNWLWFNAPHVKLKNEVFEHNYIRQWLQPNNPQKRENRNQFHCPQTNRAASQEC